MTVAKVLGKIAMKAVLGAVGGAFVCLGADFVENLVEAKNAAKTAKVVKEAMDGYAAAKDTMTEMTEEVAEKVADFSEVVEDGA